MKRKLLCLITLLSITINAQSYFEGFEGSVFPPPGWYILDNGIGLTKQWVQQANAAVPPYEGSYAAYVGTEDVDTGIPEDWLVTSQMQASDKISFFSRLSIGGDQGALYRLMITTGDPEDMGAYVLLQEWTELEINPMQVVYTEKVVDIPSEYVGQQVHFAFVLISDDGDRWMIDNISFNSCLIPANISLTSDGDQTELTASWDNSADVTQWEVYIMPANEIFTGNEQGVIAVTNSYIFTGLSAGEIYKVYTRAFCANGGVSEWSEPAIIQLLTDNTLTGTVTYDADGDTNCEFNDTVAFMQLEVTINGEYAFTTATDAYGEYTLYNLDEGESTIILQPVTPDFFPAASAVTAEVNFDGTISEEVADICLPQPAAFNNLSVSLIPSSIPIPGFNTYCMVIVTNNGSVQGSNVSVDVTFDNNRLNYISSGGNSTVMDGTVTFSIGTIEPFSTEVYAVVLNTIPPPVNIGGEEIVFTAALSQDAEDAMPDDNTTLLQQTIVNSWDPNDILVHEGDKITAEQAGEYLTYTIRFQNTGTAPATNVRLYNQLDEKLDWDTFQPLFSSKDFVVMRDGGEVQFLFDDINLPSSDTSELGSQGFVTYRIRTNDNVAPGDIIYNNAAIYFDFNEAVLTNTVTTEVVETAGVVQNNKQEILLYPNPVRDILYINTTAGINAVSIYDVNGRLCLTAQGDVINLEALKAGMYFANISTDSGRTTYKLIKQ